MGVNEEYKKREPLAFRMAPRSLSEYIGQEHILGEKGLLRRMTVRTGWESGEVMVIITINGRELPEAQLLADILSEVLDTEEYEFRSLALEYNTNKNIAAPGAKHQLVRSPAMDDTEYGSITNLALAANPSS